MSMDLLGEGFDIHGGGADLTFPHHENEIAQSEAATGRPFAKYWIHNGFVNISAEKMSKSLGNVLNIRDILKTVHPEALRLFLISSHYRSPLDYSETSIKESASALERLYAAMASLDEVIGRGGTGKVLPDELTDISNRFVEAMDDDFNTPRPLAILFDAARAINRYSAAASLSEIPSPDALTKVKNEIGALSREVLGLLREEPVRFLENLRKGGVADLGIGEEEIEELIVERAEARKRKDFARADEIRKGLDVKGILLEDGPKGTTWKVKETP
jgi:cysteinyl-tRNA synthetase